MSITVQELIKQLENMPQNAVVIVYKETDCENMNVLLARAEQYINEIIVELVY